MKDFGHVPAIQEYKEKFKQGMVDRNNGGEIGDEGEIGRNEMQNNNKNGGNLIIQNHPLFPRQQQQQQQPQPQQPVGNEIPKNPVYLYQADYEGRKEEGEDGERNFFHYYYYHSNLCLFGRISFLIFFQMMT